MSQMQPIIRRRGAKRSKQQQFSVRTESDKLRQLHKIIEDKQKLIDMNEGDNVDKTEKQQEKVQKVEKLEKTEKSEKEKQEKSTKPEIPENQSEKQIKLAIGTVDHQSNLSSSESDKIAQKTAPTEQIVEITSKPIINKPSENVDKIIKKRVNEDQEIDVKQKKLKPDENYEQRFSEMKCELQSFICYWVLKLKGSLLDTQQMIQQLEKFKL